MIAKEQFLEAFDESLKNETFIKITLSKKGSKSADLKNVYGRLVSIKNELMLSLQYRFETRDEVKNIALPRAKMTIADMLGNDFLNADLFTTGKICRQL